MNNAVCCILWRWLQPAVLQSPCSATPACFRPSLLWTASASRWSVRRGSCACPAGPWGRKVSSPRVTGCVKANRTDLMGLVVLQVTCGWCCTRRAASCLRCAESLGRSSLWVSTSPSSTNAATHTCATRPAPPQGPHSGRPCCPCWLWAAHGEQRNMNASWILTGSENFWFQIQQSFKVKLKLISELNSSGFLQQKLQKLFQPAEPFLIGILFRFMSNTKSSRMSELQGNRNSPWSRNIKTGLMKEHFVPEMWLNASDKWFRVWGWMNAGMLPWCLTVPEKWFGSNIHATIISVTFCIFSFGSNSTWNNLSKT